MIEQITESGITYKVEIDSNGTKEWYLDGKIHRVDGPAIEHANGSKLWYLNGKRHRVDGPAIEWTNGSKFWFLDGKRHRVNGPAIEWADGTKSWYLNDEELTEREFQEFRKQVKHLKKHPIDALRYVNDKHLGSVVREILEEI